MQAENDERFRSESKKKTIFNGFNFDMVNIGIIMKTLLRKIPNDIFFLHASSR